MAHSNTALRLATALLDGGARYAREANVTYDTARLLTSLELIEDADIEREHVSNAGRIDIFLPRFRTVIEVKKSAGGALPQQALPPLLVDGQAQMERYIASEILAERSRLDFSGRPQRDKRWTGILSDGRYWSCWTYGTDTTDPAATRQPSFVIRPGCKPEELLDALTGALEADPDLKTWIPADPSEIFKGRPESLLDLFRSMPDAARPSARTKLALWHDMLRASGLSPQGRAGDEAQFALHSFLIAVARMVAHLLSPTGGHWRSCLQDGFASWMLDWEGGAVWTEGLWDIVRRYDWRSRRGDVLRSLYERFVPAVDRHVFGEFYTPDWLAAMMVEQVLDRDWLERSVPAAETALQTGVPLKGVGILDPACGSGTFLYHAVRRVLQADSMRDLLPQQRAEVAALLVNGIDVHPVAVEVAKATVLRALPAEPRAGTGAVRVYLGDSLLTDEDYTALFGHRVGSMRLETPQGRAFFLPMEFVRQDNFPDAMRRLVLAAVDQRPIPPYLVQSVGVSAQQDLLECRDVLEDAVESEGNSVWTWYAVNRAAPHLLAERKVDRIVANPPWVGLASIQEPSRKRSMERLGRDLLLQAGGKQAPNLDIATYFVLRARELYLGDPKVDRAIWLVKRSALKAGHWGRFRSLHKGHLTQTVDLVELQPFGGGDARRCCLLVEHMEIPSSHPLQSGQPHLAARLRPGERNRPASDDEWAGVRRLIQVVPASPPPPQAPSEYALRVFRRGASVFPQVLLRVSNIEPQMGGRVLVRTQRSSRLQWRTVAPQQVELPRRWISKLHTSGDLYPFATAKALPRGIVPMDASGKLALETASTEPGWHALDEVWGARRSHGRNTPKTLAARLDYGGGLSAQPRTPTPDRLMVLYPKAGDNMRAARTWPGIGFADDSLYWYVASTEAEAGYLVSLLNAPCLQVAFREARSSGRNFDKSPWRNVPVPRFNRRDVRHVELADLCLNAEKTAQSVRDLFVGRGQVKVSAEIRAGLTEAGISGRIDVAASQLLPNQAQSP